MYLLLADPEDPFCTSVHQSLKARGYEARMIANPMAPPSRFACRISTFSSASWLALEDETRVSGNEIAGVLVSSPGWPTPENRRNPNDLAYLQAETRAALLAWLWSLDCPVINRYPAALWYLPGSPLLFWHPLLRRCGLRALESLVSNVEAPTRAFGAGLSNRAVYAPLTAEARYSLDNADHWDRLAAMQRHAPVHVTQATEALHSACVIGRGVVWNGTPPSDADTLEPALIRLSALAGLATLEVVIAPLDNGSRVSAVYPYPRIEGFNQGARYEIVVRLMQLLTGEDRSIQTAAHGLPGIRSTP